MYLRSNTFLKYLVILIFAFEMLGPAWVSSVQEAQPVAHLQKDEQVAERAASIEGIAHLLLEENSNEERVGRDFHFQACICFDLFDSLVKFRPVVVKHRLTQELFDSQPALFTLHRELII